MTQQSTAPSIEKFGKGSDLAGQAFREIWQAHDLGNQVKITRSFLALAPDSFIDFVIEQVEVHAEILKSWPSGAVLELEMRGEAGSYCESDTRTADMIFKVSIAGEQKVFKTSCALAKFKEEFSKNLVRVSKLVLLL